MTQADLGEKAGLTYRTVHDLELGKRNRVQEKTLMLLAQALEITLPELTGIPNGNGSGAKALPTTPPVTRKQFPWKTVLPIIVILLLAGGLTIRHWALAHARWDIEESTLVVRDGILKAKLWSIGPVPSVGHCIEAPWSNQVLIVAFNELDPDPRNVLALDRASGKVLWTFQPDLKALWAAFGKDVLDGGNLHAIKISTVDLNNDGQREILLLYTHPENYPGVLCWIDQDGKLLGQYANQGQFNDFVEADLNTDGKNELIVSGTNNARVYMGATVVILDENHFRGASVDSLNHPDSTEPDSCLVRLVLPNWPQPYMDGLPAKRLHMYKIRVFSAEKGETELSLAIGTSRNPVGMLHLDSSLNIQGIVLQDIFIENLPRKYPPELITDTGPADPAWLATWLAGCLRFGSQP